MKNLLLLIFCALGFAVSAQSTQVPSACDTSYFARFKEEAISLSVQHFLQTGNSWKDSVLIPDSVYASIARELSAIYRTKDSIPDVDTIFDILSRLPFGDRGFIIDTDILELHSLSIQVDTSVPWLSNMAHHIFPTGNDTADQLILRYNISYTFDGNTGMHIFPSIAVNPFGLGVQLSQISGVDTFYASYPRGEWSFPIRIDSGAFITYIFKYSDGDCMPDCYFHHYWKFKFHPNNCKVEFDSSYGDKFMFPNGIGVIPGNDLFISPNPTKNNLNINTSLPDLSLTITDLTGRICSAPHTDRAIDISSLAAGVYTIRLQSRDAITVRRFVKE